MIIIYLFRFIKILFIKLKLFEKNQSSFFKLFNKSSNFKINLQNLINNFSKIQSIYLTKFLNHPYSFH